MKVNIIKYPKDNDWLLVKNNALVTVGKESDKFPDTKWKTKILVSEHSPIRDLIYTWEWINLPSWVSTHLVRHKFGIEHFVKSQRNDRQKEYDRTKAPQDAPVNHRCTANAQAILNISHRRLCNCASKETIVAWRLFLAELSLYSPELTGLCVPSCIYRNGICPEVFSPCGYNNTDQFKDKLIIYKQILNLLKE